MDSYCSIDVAVKKLVDQMTLEEKASFCSGQDFWNLKGLARLSLPTIMMTDGPHGLRKQLGDGDHLGIFDSVQAICFPTASALASSWDAGLLTQVGEALGEQSRAENVAVILGPGLNIKRHPLGGRNFEYFSEDPLLSGVMAAALVNGIQSRGVGACLKHFAVNNQETHRMVTDAVVDERTLREIYLRGFEIAVQESNPWCIMIAYNRLNGDYCSEHDFLTNTILRDEWDYQGMVVSDWMATVDRVAGVKSGMDLEMPGNQGQNDAAVMQAIDAGELSVEALNEVVSRVTKLILKSVEGKKTDYTLDKEKHHQLAHKAACKSAVLLKNENDTLPLKQGLSVAVIGEFAKRPRYQGSGSSLVNPTQLDNAWGALQRWAESGTDLGFAKGYDAKHCEQDQGLIDEAAALAEKADIALVFAGLPDSYESEGFDRSHINLPEQHNRLIEAVAAKNKSTIVILHNGSAVTMPWVSQVASVLEIYLAGQASGSAVVDLLTGNANPCGKLAETFALNQEDALSDCYFPGKPRQVQYREGLYVGYRFFNTVNKDVLFPFGHGLSYTYFDYLNITLSNNHHRPDINKPLMITGVLSNSGKAAGEEIIQVYARATRPSIHRPKQVLAGFTKIALGAGESKPFEVVLDDKAFAFYCVEHQAWQFDPGEYEVQVGASSRDIRCSIRVRVAAEENAPKRSLEDDFFRGITAETGSVPDDVFSSLLGKDIPLAESVRPFTRNSTFSEICTSRLGALVTQYLGDKINTELNVQSDDEDASSMMEHLIPGIPLRALVVMSNGKFTYRHLDSLIHLLNRNYLKGFWCFIRNRGA